MAADPGEGEIGSVDDGIESVTCMDDAHDDREAVGCVNAGEIQAKANGEIARRIEGRKCTDFVHVDHGDTSEKIGYLTLCYWGMSRIEVGGVMGAGLLTCGRWRRSSLRRRLSAEY